MRTQRTQVFCNRCVELDWRTARQIEVTGGSREIENDDLRAADWKVDGDRDLCPEHGSEKPSEPI